MKSIKLNIKSLKYILSLFLVIGFACHCFAQNIKSADSSKYDSLIQQISVLNHYDLKQWNVLSVLIADTAYEHEHKIRCYPPNDSLLGWMIKSSNDSISFLEVSGIELNIKKERIKSIDTIGIHDSLTDLLYSYCNSNHFMAMYKWSYHSMYEGHYEMPYYLVALWLYQKGNRQSAYHLLQESYLVRYHGGRKLPWNQIIELHFGNLYYNLMLVAYAINRDYTKATEYGSYFNGTDYKNFVYTKTAIELKDQLKQRTDDFNSFCIPDSLSWIQLKSAFDRKEQINYLAERLRLLNCRQHGQPDGINFTDAQYAGINYHMMRDSAKSLDWKSLQVINPYNEILAMNLDTSEVATLLPYLNDTSYIPTYWYWRDFSSSREVYRLNEVIATLISQITNVHPDNDKYRKPSPEEMKQKIEDIKLWCLKNSR